jgi:hypothetical protein
LRDRDIDRVQRMVRASARPKPVAETHEVHFIDGFQHPHDRLLDDLVFQRCDPQRSPPAVGLSPPRPFARLRSVPPALYPIVQVRQSLFELLAVLPPRHAVYSGRRIALQRPVRPSQQFHRHVVHQVGEPLPPVPLRCLSYPAQSARRCFPPLRAGHGRLARVPLGRGPSLHGLRGWVARMPGLRTVVRPLHRYYVLVRLPSRVQVRRGACGLPRPDRRWDCPGRFWDLPVSVHGACVHALVLGLRGPGSLLALAQRPVLPSLRGDSVGNPDGVISELHRPACTPPVNASPPPSRGADA